MEHRAPDPQRVFLSILPAQRTERRIASAVVLASLAISLATVPFAKVQLPKVDAFIPIYESALTFTRATGEVYREGFDIIAKPYSADSLAEALRRTIAEAGQMDARSRDTA